MACTCARIRLRRTRSGMSAIRSGIYANPAGAPAGVDARSGGEFPVGTFPILGIPAGGTVAPVAANPLYGNIKISAVAGAFLNTTTVYASVATPNRTLSGTSSSLIATVDRTGLPCHDAPAKLFWHSRAITATTSWL